MATCKRCGGLMLTEWPHNHAAHLLAAKDPDPDPRDLVRELRQAVGLFDGAMAISPKEAWDEAIAVVRRLAGTRPVDQVFPSEFDGDLVRVPERDRRSTVSYSQP